MEFHLTELLGGGISSGDRHRTPALAAPMEEDPQDELVPVANEELEL